MKVFAYLRVSSAQQIDGNGWERQEIACRKLCDSRGWSISRVFREQQTGADEFKDRKIMAEMMDLAGEGAATGVTAIVVEGADRIARDLMVQEMFLAQCRKQRVEVFVADCGEEIANAKGDGTRTLIRQMLGALAQWERTMITKRLQAGRRKKARETGRPCGGPPPYGQTDSERAVIADIVRMRNRGQTFLSIARVLRETGFPTPTGKPFWGTGTVFAIYKRERNA
jgi:DNA invertase Pin-like site-specific DNA recombinase